MNFLKSLLVSLLVCALFVAGMEWILGKKFPKSPIVSRYIRLRESPVNEHRVLPMTESFRKECDGLGKDSVEYRTDGNGFMEPSIIYPSPDQTIVFMGGSTTFCKWVDEKNRYPYLVGRLLEEKTGLRINSINAGVPGNHSMHSLNALVNKILPLHPDIVVLHHNINDLVTLMILGSYWNDHFRRSLILTDSSYSWRGFFMFVRYRLLRNTCDYFLAFPFFENLTTKYQYRNQDEFDSIRGKMVHWDDDEIASEFEKSLQNFVDVCRGRGIRVVLMTQPNRFTEVPDPIVRVKMNGLASDFGISYESFRRDYLKFNNVIRRVAKVNDVPLVDLANLVPPTSGYIYDTVHLNDNGSQEVAAMITEHLMPICRAFLSVGTGKS
ncbi:MAG: SGNH/GDSL hydrolase family protein [Candidatus Omnitrophica bacterium]|nr:SGNH/GDSL hydrolase family protein [Candidatus Omnitrophota bacterium]